MSQLFFKDIQSVGKLIRKKEISIVELTEQMLERISSIDPVLNAYITILPDEAKKQAQLLEKELLDGNDRGPLHGIPIAIKDIFETKGSITTSGSKVFADYISKNDAEIVSKLKEAGAIIIGKTNLHEFAMGATTENPHYGPTRNPWNINKIPGGSSGGSAAAVASGLAFGAVGTDTGGSIRLPSAICGIVGLKPTYDLVSTKGCTPLSWSLDHIGPMTRTVNDSRIMLRAMMDSGQLSKVDLEVLDLETLKGIRIGYCKTYFFENMDEDMETVIYRALDKLRKFGAEIVEMNIPGIEEALNAQRIISISEAYTFHEPYFSEKGELYGKDVQIRLNAGREVLASQYIRAKRIQKTFSNQMLNIFSEKNCHVLFTPTNTIAPYDIGSISPLETMNNIFRLGRTPIGNLLGFPAITVPCGFNSEKLPVGFQLIGRPYDDGLLLNIGEMYEKEENWISHLEKNEAYLFEQTQRSHKIVGLDQALTSILPNTP
ncbi:Glutamyl-tRNA(Gln) amidotransferase subunit A [Geobacillus sp. 12AMOR1]|nr:Glutamyl-tRNA(Gln) amidotransferase subunit A [Geobacillus sp. 12AMOR1]